MVVASVEIRPTSVAEVRMHPRVLLDNDAESCGVYAALDIDQLPGLPEFPVWMAEALAWARYAKRDDEFFAAAAGFISYGYPARLDTATDFPDRFGPQRLRDALAAYRCWYEEMEMVLRDIEPEPVRWKALQEKSLRVAERLKSNGELRQVGLWLFPAPFKIMAVAHPETWREQALDADVMPTGPQVVRALKMLHRDGVVALDKYVLGASEKTFADEYTNLWTLQLAQRTLATSGKTSIHTYQRRPTRAWRRTVGSAVRRIYHR